MKPYVEVIKDSFVDYAGKTHHFVIAAVSKPCEENTASVIWDDWTVEVQESLSKGLSIGISICNPEDTFDEKVGVLKAVSRAQKSDPVLYVTNPGYINSTLVKAFLQQEANYLKNNPELYIEGYSDAKKRYLKKKNMEEMKDNFSSTEKIIVEEVQKNPKFLDNVSTYLAWLKNQENGKRCKKSGK